METLDENKEQPQGIKINLRILLIAAAIILLCAPVIWLIAKRGGTQPLPPQEVVGIEKLERKATDYPTYANLLALSAAYINAKLPVRAIPVLEKALLANPRKAEAYNNLGVCYTMMGDFDKGMENCRKAIQIDSTSKLYRNNFKWASTEKVGLISRISNFEKQAESSKNQDYYINYGFCYYKLKDYKKSIDIWSQGLIKYPTNVVLINNVGAALMMMGKTDEAIARFAQALRAEPANQLSKNNLAWGLDVKKKATK